MTKYIRIDVDGFDKQSAQWTKTRSEFVAKPDCATWLIKAQDNGNQTVFCECYVRTWRGGDILKRDDLTIIQIARALKALKLEIK